MNKRVLALIVTLPLLSVIAVALLYAAAVRVPDATVQAPEVPLSKTSWRTAP